MRAIPVTPRVWIPVASALFLLTAGKAHAQSGTVWAWGHNGYGQLGDNTLTTRLTPVQVSGLTDATAVAAGSGHSLALVSDHTVRSWGRNDYGQLGDGTNTQRKIPVQVSGLTGVTVVAAGLVHSLARKADGTAWCWGDNVYGQLGDGTTTNRLAPVQVATLTTVRSVTAGNHHSLALMDDGTVWSWGRNDDGQLGNGTTTSSLTPVQVTGLASVKAIGAGAYHSLAICEDGTVWAWGYNGYGQLGDGSYTSRSTPVPVAGATGATQVSAGDNHSVACMGDGTVKSWGRNNRGQLGDGTATTWNTPVQVIGITSAERVAASGSFCVAGLTDGTLRSWGSNVNGQLGNGTQVGSSTPVQVLGPGGSGVLSHIRGIECGAEHTVALWLNTRPTADHQWLDVTPGTPKDITLTGADGDGDLLSFEVVAPPSHGHLTGDPPNVVYTTDATYDGSDSFTFRVSDGYSNSVEATVSISTVKQATTLWTSDRAGTITGLVILRQYDLKRVSDNVLLEGELITYRIDGTAVGEGVTNAGGDSTLNWIITDGPASRTIEAVYAGSGLYEGCSDDAMLTCQTHATKMTGANREGKITAYRIFKAWLYRLDNTPVVGKSITFKLDGTWLGTDNTRSTGLAQIGYTIADGAGAGTRTILAEWAGDGGYRASSCANTLTVQKATPYIWVMPRSVPQGGIARLYAYFRRLADYQKQEGKTVTFKVDGTRVADVLTGTGPDAGIARYSYTTVQAAGAHTIRCEFPGDAWVDAGHGEATLTVY